LKPSASAARALPARRGRRRRRNDSLRLGPPCRGRAGRPRAAGAPARRPRVEGPSRPPGSVGDGKTGAVPAPG